MARMLWVPVSRMPARGTPTMMTGKNRTVSL